MAVARHHRHRISKVSLMTHSYRALGLQPFRVLLPDRFLVANLE